MVGTLQLEMCFSEKDLGMLMNTELNVSQHCVLAARMSTSAQGCSRMSVASRLREVIPPPTPAPYSTSEASALGSPVQEKDGAARGSSMNGYKDKNLSVKT